MTSSEIAPDVDADREAIHRVHDHWLAAERRRDITGVLALCTSDVRWLVPGTSPLEGPEAGGRLLGDSQVELDELTATDVRIEVSGALAYKTSHYETRFRVHGHARVSRGTHMWILRREEAGWRVALVTWQPEA